MLQDMAKTDKIPWLVYESFTCLHQLLLPATHCHSRSASAWNRNTNRNMNRTKNRRVKSKLSALTAYCTRTRCLHLLARTSFGITLENGCDFGGCLQEPGDPRWSTGPACPGWKNSVYMSPHIRAESEQEYGDDRRWSGRWSEYV